MLFLFITYVILGLSLSLPVGAMTIEMSKQGLRNGFLYGWMVGIGGMTIDLFMILLIYFGLASFLVLSPVQTAMWLIGSVFLLYIGFESIKEANESFLIGEEEHHQKSLFKTYITGLLMALSPANIVFWMGIFGTALTAALGRIQGYEFLFVAAGILVGILIHDVLLLGVINYSRRFLGQTVIKWTSIIAGILLIGFGSYFGYTFLIELKKVL